MTPPDVTYHLGTRNHLLITPEVVCRGVVTPCAGRLADHLRSLGRRELVLRDVTYAVAGGPKQTAREMQIATSELIAAHEYVALGGDPGQRTRPDPLLVVAVRCVILGMRGTTVAGTIERPALEWQRRFLAVQHPEVAGTTDESRAFADAVRGLPYVLLHRERIEALAIETRSVS